MKQWETLEQLITEEEKQRLFELAKQQILTSMVRDSEYPGRAFLEAIDWQDSCYQVVYSKCFNSRQREEYYRLSELMFFGTHENRMSYEFPEGDGNILVLRGKAAVERLNAFIEHYLTTPPQQNSPMYSLFFTCGSVVKRPEDVYKSYKMAVELMQRRFFAGRDQHMMDEKALQELQAQERAPLQEEDVTHFCDALVDSIQTFNKSLLGKQMDLLYDYLAGSHEEEQKVRMFLTEVYIQTRGKIREKYPAAEKYTENSRMILQSIFGYDYLYEILDCMAQELDAIMHAIGAPSRDSVLNDILFYIQHNIGEQLKLERIAPLFGYNSAYLGKIFKQNVGESFNSYVDRIRIEQAKELLKQEKLKVYEISERVGYRNVDYFHKKFLKNVGMSPAAYRKMLLENKKNENNNERIFE